MSKYYNPNEWDYQGECTRNCSAYQQGISDERERILKELEKQEEHCLSMSDWQGQSAIDKAIEIARGE